MEFRLTYEGRLPTAGRGDYVDKHRIRRALSGQLEQLWKTHPRLRFAAEQDGGAGYSFQLWARKQAQKFDRCGRRFLPLIHAEGALACSLDILFLRRDPPGRLISNGGDIDNRIKVLFDALRLPSNKSEVSGDAGEDPDPFFCLLEDDCLISEFKVTTDRLLAPLSDGEHQNDVRLVIHVKTIVIDSGDLHAVLF